MRRKKTRQRLTQPAKCPDTSSLCLLLTLNPVQDIFLFFRSYQEDMHLSE